MVIAIMSSEGGGPGSTHKEISVNENKRFCGSRAHEI